MRRALIPLFSAILLLGACGDDDSPNTDTSVTDTTADTTPDTTVPDTTVPDTTTPDTTVPDTTTPDTTAPDTTTPDVAPDPAEGICPGLAKCLSVCANETCETTCLDAADSEAEANLATAYTSCLETNNCTTSEFPTAAESKTAIECERSSCLGQKADCIAGDTFGNATCAVTGQCLQACGEEDLLCQRACITAASEQSANAFFDYSLCVARECFGSVNFQTCSQQAASAVGPCSTVYNACYGDAGAAPGAGGGGGLPR